MSKFLPRTMGIRKVTRELKRFSIVDTESERHASSTKVCSFRHPLASRFLTTPSLRHAPHVGTVGLQNRTSLSPVREKGDKVFGERSARLLNSSSRTPMTTSPTTTSSPTSTTSSTTRLAKMSTPSRVLLLLLLSCTCSCFFC